MFDFCLKFTSQAEAQTTLFDGETPRYAAVDLIGEIEGTTGYHANVRHGAECPELAGWVVFPVTPSRVWA